MKLLAHVVWGVAAIATLWWLPPTTEGAQIRPATPVMVGGQEADEGCVGTAVVAVRNGSSLNLRAGPGVGHPVLARLIDGQTVTICQRLPGGWVGVLVSRDSAKPRDCNVSGTGRQAKAYGGPCDSGWVREAYLRLLAG